MERILRACKTGALAAIFLWCMFNLALAQGTFYKYVDKNGTVHFTDRLESIPPEYRNQVKIRKQEVEKPSPPSAKPGPGDKTGGSASTAEKEKGSEAAQAAQEKVQGEREEKERIQRARQEKNKEIEKLRKEIEAKDKEASSLRTNWMVYDKIRLNQLNEEKEKLLKEVQALQEELGKMK
jgi:hypothetical protein